MEKRHFRSDRLYKLLKLIVIAVSFLSLVSGIYMALNYNTTSKYMTDMSQECLKNQPTALATCGVFYESLNNYNSSMFSSFLVAVLLPLCFFGGVFVFNLLFPKRNPE